MNCEWATIHEAINATGLEYNPSSSLHLCHELEIWGCTAHQKCLGEDRADARKKPY